MATQRATIKGAPARRRGRVLLVIDQPVLAAVVTLALKHGPFITRTAQDVALATSALTDWQPHLAIVDMDIGQGQLLQALGEAHPSAGRLPVIALTRRGDLRTKLAAFEWGVEDILSVPFSLAELVARILVVMRRHYRATVAFAPTIRLGELEIDLLNHQVRAGTAEVRLTAVEQSLLYLLAANAGRVVTRDEILDALWGPTTWRTATSSISTSAIYAPSCTTIGGSHGISPPSVGGATASCRGRQPRRRCHLLPWGPTRMKRLHDAARPAR